MDKKHRDNKVYKEPTYISLDDACCYVGITKRTMQKWFSKYTGPWRYTQGHPSLRVVPYKWLTNFCNGQLRLSGKVTEIKNPGCPWYEFIEDDLCPVHEIENYFSGERKNNNCVQLLKKLVKDVEEMKQMVERRSEDIDHFLIYNTLPIMLLSIDPKSASILDCNQAVCDRLDYSKDEIVGRLIFDFYLSKEKAKDAFKDLLLHGEARMKDLFVRAKSGETVKVDLSVRPVRDIKGNVLYTCSVWNEAA